MIKKIYFVTSNKNKLREARQILDIQIEALPIKIDEVQTLDPIECAKKKAQAAFFQAKKPILVEDTILFFDAWNGLPGVFVDYFMKTIGNDGLLKLMIEQNNRSALAQTTFCFYDGNKFIFGVGKTAGKIVLEAVGENGFGWDSIFMPDNCNKTFAQMSAEEKNKTSMRKMALEDLKSSFICLFLKSR